MPSQKPIFPVLGLIVVMLISVYSVSYLADRLYFQPAREKLLRMSIGDTNFECLKSNELRREGEERRLLSTDPKMMALGDELSVARKLTDAIYLGLLYLFSSLIVRTLRRMIAANQSFQRTPSAPLT